MANTQLTSPAQHSGASAAHQTPRKHITASTLHYANDHAWAWFSMHAQQRMTMFNFWILAITVVSGGYVQSFVAKRALLAAVIALIGMTLTISFRMFERRSVELVDAGRIALCATQNRLAEETHIPELRMIDLSFSCKRSAMPSSDHGEHQQTAKATPYSRVLQILHWVIAGVFSFALWYAIAETATVRRSARHAHGLGRVLRDMEHSGTVVALLLFTFVVALVWISGLKKSDT